MNNILNVWGKFFCLLLASPKNYQHSPPGDPQLKPTICSKVENKTPAAKSLFIADQSGEDENPELVFNFNYIILVKFL